MVTPSFSSHFIQTSTMRLQHQLASLHDIAHRARESALVHEHVDDCIRILMEDLTLLSGLDAPLTRSQKDRIAAHLEILANVATEVNSRDSIAAWFKDRFSKERTTAKQEFSAIAQATQEAFRSIELVVDNRGLLEDPHFSKAVMTPSSFLLETLRELAISGNDRAQSDLINLALENNPQAVEYLKIVIQANPAILDKLTPPIIATEPIFQILLELADNQDCLAKETLIKAVFAESNLFKPLFPKFASDRFPIGKILFMTLVMFFPDFKKILDDIPEDPQKILKNRIEITQKWLDRLKHRTRSYLIKNFDEYPPIFRQKIIFAYLVKQETLLQVLVDTKFPSSLPPPSMSKCFAPTNTWLVGTPARTVYEGDLYLPPTMATIGKSYGITVMSGGREEGLEDVRMCRSSPGDTWVQDNMTLGIERSARPVVRIPAISGERSYAYTTKIENRRESRGLGAISLVLGASQARGEQMRALEFAQELGLPFSMSPCFTEEGNSLVGRDAEGNPYVIVGQDTIEYIKLQISNEMKELGLVKNNKGKWIPATDPSQASEPSDEEIKQLLALNYGVQAEHVYFCEQPGDYHVDTAMKIIGPKTVMLNDSVAAAAHMKAHLERESLHEGMDEATRSKLDRFDRRAAEIKEIEDKTAADLEAQGFTVIRFGGRTYNPLEREEFHQVNLFNFVSATSPEDPPKKLIVAMGCPESFQALFRTFMRSQVPDIRPDDIHFLEEEWSRNRLVYGGGVECMTKAF